MEADQNYSCDQKLPSLSARYQWFIAQNLEAHTQLFYTLGNKQNYYHCRIHELRGRRIRACFHGWVILSNHPDNVLWSLWNPLTSKLIRLPPLIHDKKRSHQCCLSAPPDDQGSAVLLLTTTQVATIVFCRLDRKRKKLKWTEMSYAKQLQTISGVDHDCFLECPTCCNGKVYAMTLGPYYRSVIHVDVMVKGKEVVISLLPFVEIPYVSLNRCPSYNNIGFSYSFLKGSTCMELFYIEVSFEDGTSEMIGDVHLFKLDATSMMWEEMADLKSAIFFLELASDYSACYYGSAGVDSELGGYVHILGESGKIIYSFHAKDRTVSISSMPYTIQESQVSSWTMLEWRLEIDHAESNQEEEEDKDTQMMIIRPAAKVDNIIFNGTIGGESHLLNIPIHILEMIMELCVGIEYMRFRATCKHCCLAAPPIQWKNKKTLQMYSLVSPWLMVLDSNQGIITFIDPICGERYFMKTPQELKGDYQIYCSRYGWLLMYKIENGHMAFFNPLTSKILKLPLAPYLESFCFSAPPTSRDCMVVGFTTSGQWHVFIHFVSRESTWRLFRLNFGGDDAYSYRFPTFFKGRNVFGVCNNGGIGAFRDVTEVDYSWEVVVDKAPRSCCISPTRYYLSSCDQHLLLVIVGKFGESIEVFKLNESTEEWQQINKLGKHMIYISGNSCICLDARSSEMENKIYFPRLFHNEDTKIVFYSLETHRYHTFDGKNIQESFGADLLGTKQHSYPHTWIEPSWS